jgi:hypothetical protein
MIAARGVTPSIPPSEDANHRAAKISGLMWRDDAIARFGCREWWADRGYGWRSFAENAM